MRRRELIQWLAAAAAAPNDLLAFGRDVHRRASQDPALRALSAQQARTVAVAADRILPGADVRAFIDKMLADWYTPAEREQFLAGLAELDKRCRARGPRDFVDCMEADQVAVLTALDEAVTYPDTTDHWFARLKYLTVYGYCTSEAGMRALRLHPLPMRYDGCAPL